MVAGGGGFVGWLLMLRVVAGGAGGVFVWWLLVLRVVAGGGGGFVWCMYGVLVCKASR